MSLPKKFERAFKYILPSPFSIAVLLTVFVFAMAWLFSKPAEASFLGYGADLIGYWSNGLWNKGLMVFAMQMMLMLVLGHTLALTKSVSKFIDRVTTRIVVDGATAAYWVTLLTVLVAFFNWGLGLIFGAILARKVGEYATKNNIKINYSLVGAAGYSGLMVWHGGISGSALAKVAEKGELFARAAGTGLTETQMKALPASISYTETVFSSMNISVGIALLVFLPLLMFLIGKKTKHSIPKIYTSQRQTSAENIYPTGAEKIDQRRIFSLFFGGFVLLAVLYQIAQAENMAHLDFITPNFINLLLLALALLLHSNFNSFLKAVQEAISGASGILIQFPLYFGIMGIMNNSGMVTDISEFFVSLCTSENANGLYPILTFCSAGIVNVFVPSGGGQWAVQGPIIIKAATDMDLPLAKSIMAMAYGDQLTNMLQPFWALPLLGITKLKGKDILPYTLLLMCAGIVIFMLGLLLF